jgi:hypothetical protein
MATSKLSYLHRKTLLTATVVAATKEANLGAVGEAETSMEEDE